MKHKIEINVRQQSAGRNLLMMYVPAAMRERLLEGLARGVFEIDDVEIHVELSVLPEWVTDNSNPAHARIPISAITASYPNELK